MNILTIVCSFHCNPSDALFDLFVYVYATLVNWNTKIWAVLWTNLLLMSNAMEFLQATKLTLHFNFSHKTWQEKTA
jgi:hypothetical protein